MQSVLTPVKRGAFVPASIVNQRAGMLRLSGVSQASGSNAMAGSGTVTDANFTVLALVKAEPVEEQTSSMVAWLYLAFAFLSKHNKLTSDLVYGRTETWDHQVASSRCSFRLSCAGMLSLNGIHLMTV